MAKHIHVDSDWDDPLDLIQASYRAATQRKANEAAQTNISGDKYPFDMFPVGGLESEAPAVLNKIRTFNTGATRDTDTNKLDFEAFLSPLVLEHYAQFMHKNRVQADGKLRDGDNWSRGIDKVAYQKSLTRHFMSAWKRWRGWSEDDLKEQLCAIIFNAHGLLYELLREDSDSIYKGSTPLHNTRGTTKGPYAV